MIRIATEADVPAMLAIYAPYVLETTYSFEYEVPTEEEFTERFRRITRQFPWLVWEADGKILGYAYGSAPFERAAYRWSCESSIYVRPEAQGQGIGRRLYAALEQIMALQGYRVCYAIITAENQPSMDFHKKCGYTCTAHMPNCGWKFGRWLGVTWMEKTIHLVQCPSSFPISWQILRQDAQKISDILDILSLS